jgi:hypothetical protein
MFKTETLRWVFLLLAILTALRCLWSGAAPGRLLFGAVCAVAWYALSRRKVLSLDRQMLGIPPRRR